MNEDNQYEKNQYYLSYILWKYLQIFAYIGYY